MAEATDRMAMLREKYQESAAAEESEVGEWEAVQPVEPAAEQAGGETAPERIAEPAGRDDKGRFTPGKDGKEKPTKVEKPTQTAAGAGPAPVSAAPAAAAAPPASVGKPPQSWSHAEREAWSKMAPEAQRAVLRREQETAKVLQENAALRKGYGEIRQRVEGIDSFVRPFEGIFRAQGIEPMQGVANLVQTYAALYMGTQPQRDGILAQLIGQFGSLEGINAYLQGQAPMPQAQPQPAPPTQSQQAPQDVRALLREELGAIQQQAALSRADKDFEAFQATNPEFLEIPGVWEAMEQFLDLNATRGRDVTFQQAYDFAVQMDPEVKATLQQRAAAAAATQPNAGASSARARAAAGTIKTKPAASVENQVDLTDRRAMIQQMAERIRR